MANSNIYDHKTSLLTPTGRSDCKWYGEQKIPTIECVCICGNVIWVNKYNYNYKKTVSCGCYGKKVIGDRSRTHGYTNTRTYRCYGNMKTRCYYKNYINYHRYGGRGIKVCDRWLESFENFLEDMGECPTNKHTIERIDVDGNYEPNNCKWATMLEQQNNKTNGRKLIYKGKSIGVAELARRVGIPRSTISGWLNIDHCTDEEVIKRIFIRNNIQ